MIGSNSNPSYKIISTHGFAEIVENIFLRQRSLHAITSFNAGDIICSFEAKDFLTQPTYLTIQIKNGQHITLQPAFLQYINHSCNPSVFFDVTNWKLIALMAIEAGDELTFFYPSTEWEMAQPFVCFCNAANCLHNIQGAADLDEKILAHYRLTDFIQQQIKKR
jgi:hypothetical protein